VPDETAMGRDNGALHSRCAGPTPQDISQMESSAEFGTGGSPTICSKEVVRLQQVPRRSTYPMRRRAQVLNGGAGGRD